MKWYLIIVLSYILLMTADTKHLFMWLLIISNLLSLQVYSDHLPIFMGLHFLLLNSKISLCILDISPLLDIWFANIFFYFVGYLSLDDILWIIKILNLKKSNLSRFSLAVYAFGVIDFQVFKTIFNTEKYAHAKIASTIDSSSVFFKLRLLTNSYLLNSIPKIIWCQDFSDGAVDKNPLPMQGTWVWSLIREDPTCCGATEPVCYNSWTCALEALSRNCWAHKL